MVFAGLHRIHIKSLLKKKKREGICQRHNKVTPTVQSQNEDRTEGKLHRYQTLIRAPKLELLPSDGCLTKNACPAPSSYLHSSSAEVVSLFYFILSSQLLATLNIKSASSECIKDCRKQRVKVIAHGEKDILKHFISSFTSQLTRACISNTQTLNADAETTFAQGRRRWKRTLCGSI